MAEDATVVNDEVMDNASTDSTPVEQEESTVELTEPTIHDGTVAEESEDESVEGDESEESTDTDDEPTDTQEEPHTKADQRKEQLNTEIRDLVAQRNQLKTQVEQMNQEAYKVPSEQDLQNEINPDTGEYYTTLEAKLTRMEQQQQLREYTEKVTENQLTISTEAQRALHDFPIFDQNSPEYNREIAEQVDQILQQNLIIDQKTGQIIGSRISPYQLYKSYDVATKATARKAQIQGQKSVEKMMATSDISTGGKGAEKPFAKMSVAEQEAYLRKKGPDV